MVGHKGAVLDIKWNPFDENVIASASEDCTVKVWEIPEDGLTENLTKEVVNLVGHNRRVGFLEWHPTAEHVLATAGYDYMVNKEDAVCLIPVSLCLSVYYLFVVYVPLSVYLSVSLSVCMSVCLSLLIYFQQ